LGGRGGEGGIVAEELEKSSKNSWKFVQFVAKKIEAGVSRVLPERLRR